MPKWLRTPLNRRVGFQGTVANVDGQMVAAYNVYVKAPSETSDLGIMVARGVLAEKAKYALANLIKAYLDSGSQLGFAAFLGSKSAEELVAIIG